MVTQSGLSPTSTLKDVRSVLQNAITHEEATIRSAQERLDCYQQQLASLTALVGSFAENGTNGTATENNGTALVATVVEQASVAPVETDVTPVAAPLKTTPKRSSKPRKEKRTSVAKAAAKETAPPQVQVQETTDKPLETAPGSSETSEEALQAASSLPKLLKRFREKRLTDAIAQVLEESEAPLSSQEIAQVLYGSTQLADKEAAKKAVRMVSNNLTRGVKGEKWRKVSDKPSPKYFPLSA